MKEWGKGVVKNLSDYLNKTEPDLKGFSSQNLWRMKQFYEAYYTNPKLPPLVREISWANNMIILSKSKTEEEREFYIRLSIKERLDFFIKLKWYTFEVKYWYTFRLI